MSVLVSDGVHSVTAQCALRVTIITDEMLTHSITLRLEDMSPERFPSPLLGLFIQAVAATLPDHVVVFNVQRDTDDPGMPHPQGEPVGGPAARARGRSVLPALRGPAGAPVPQLQLADSHLGAARAALRGQHLPAGAL